MHNYAVKEHKEASNWPACISEIWKHALPHIVDCYNIQRTVLEYNLTYDNMTPVRKFESWFD